MKEISNKIADKNMIAEEVCLILQKFVQISVEPLRYIIRGFVIVTEKFALLETLADRKAYRGFATASANLAGSHPVAINKTHKPNLTVELVGLVRVTGFEPAASCSQSRRATNCATPGYSIVP